MSYALSGRCAPMQYLSSQLKKRTTSPCCNVSSFCLISSVAPTIHSDPIASRRTRTAELANLNLGPQKHLCTTPRRFTNNRDEPTDAAGTSNCKSACGILRVMDPSFSGFRISSSLPTQNSIQ
ncbi:hypothetical protein SCLCIDRAFT_405197 [Scleroderma citrinum Foug A]|uniref:Uncharacterized protein n=1 Tax=Scleroderma citrinum Foug A TaxID=1036808 RepID=A0A0C3CZK4_9AGAM|nr:hypothetical protein SCLCIDRAFT_405197 [Scleroderma citrinum Foug A]